MLNLLFVIHFISAALPVIAHGAPQEARSESRSSVSLEVIGAGFGRTGTSSLREALNLLGYRTYHMNEVIKNDAHLEEWLAVLKEEKSLSEVVDTVLPGYTAVVDFPSMTHWEELAQLYPHAKIILTERSSPEQWWESASETILIPSLVSRILFTLDLFFWRCFGNLLCHLWYKAFHLDRPRHVTLQDRDLVLQAYQSNSQKARTFDEHITHYDGEEKKQQRVLVYHVSQGWEPLCAFLGKPVPPANISFPHVNSRSSFQQNMLLHLVNTLLKPIAALIAVFLSLALFLRCCYEWQPKHKTM